MRTTVTDYGTLKRTNDTLDTIIQGTACFPGGSGLWRGESPCSALPQAFPERPVMFVAHNFDKDESYRQSLRQRIEPMNDPFWNYLRAYIREAGATEDICFFTNALMGLQPVRATGPMNATPLFREQCSAFLTKQIEVVAPRCVAILGDDAAEAVGRVSLPVPSVRLKHPSWLRYVKMELRPPIIKEQGALLLRLLE